jgi:hypothetical protein
LGWGSASHKAVTYTTRINAHRQRFEPATPVFGKASLMSQPVWTAGKLVHAVRVNIMLK